MVWPTLGSRTAKEQEHTHLTALFSGTTRVSRYQKGKTNLDFTEARETEWQWHQLGHMQVCISLQTTMPVPHRSSFLQAGYPSCQATNSVKALKAFNDYKIILRLSLYTAVAKTVPYQVSTGP